MFSIYLFFSIHQPNEAGVAFETVMYETWGTNASMTLQGGESFSVVGHKGTYEVRITQDGQETVETLVIGDDTDVTVDLTGKKKHYFPWFSFIPLVIFVIMFCIECCNVF